jgi:hypothetical protein
MDTICAFNVMLLKKKSQLSNRLSKLRSVFTVEALAMRSSKLDPISIYFKKLILESNLMS